MNDPQLRNKLIRLAYDRPELRGDILPMLRENKKMAGGKKAAACPLATNFVGLVGMGTTLVTKKVQESWEQDYTILAATAMTETQTTLERLKTAVLKDPAGSRVGWLVEQLACNVTDLLFEVGRAKKDAKLKMGF